MSTYKGSDVAGPGKETGIVCICMCVHRCAHVCTDVCMLW